jgi:dUTP pyrophosphatase
MNKQDDTNIYNLLSYGSPLMVLKMYVSAFDSSELKNIYKEAIIKHNNKILYDEFPDSGFDLYLPDDFDGVPGETIKINFNVKCSARMYYNKDTSTNSAFSLLPRSSLSKTQLRLANSIGLIDSGYRGNLIGVFDCKQNFQEDGLKKYVRLLQICAPNYVPIYVILVDSEQELGTTSRGSGAFGSTGR